jgi:hypothetical protein
MSAISIKAVLDGVVHPLDTRERMFAWFRRRPTAAEYRVSHLGRTHEFDGIPFREPTSPSDLVAKALDRLPGRAPRDARGDWSVLDDFTRGQCGWLALALAERIGGRTMICGRLRDDGEERDPCDWGASDHDPCAPLPASSLGGFMHAGALRDGQVYCALGRGDPGLWAYRIARSETLAMSGTVAPATLRGILAPLPSAVERTIPDVVELIAQLVGDEAEPRHPDPWTRHLATSTCRAPEPLAPTTRSERDEPVPHAEEISI